MGWFEDKDGHLLGDDPLDRLGSALREVAAAYQSSAGRRPTAAELETLLATVLRGLGGEVLDGLDELEVVGVDLETKKRPRRQPFEVGDTFAVPLGDGRFAFGRIIHGGKGKETVVEIFRQIRPQPTPGPDVAASGRLFPPLSVMAAMAFPDRRWPVVHHEPGFRPADAAAIRFHTFPMGKEGGKVNIHGLDGALHAEGAPLSALEGLTSEPLIFWPPKSVEDRIRAALAKG
jgi:hypothetical protein